MADLVSAAGGGSFAADAAGVRIRFGRADNDRTDLQELDIFTDVLPATAACESALWPARRAGRFASSGRAGHASSARSDGPPEWAPGKAGWGSHSAGVRHQ